MKTLQLLTVISATATATLFQANAAQAMTLYLNQASSGGGVYNYDITLDAGETLTSGIDSLALTGLEGVEGASANLTPNGTSFALVDFDETSANFEAAGSFTGVQSFTNAITLTAPDATTGDMGFLALTGGTGGGSFSGIAQGPTTASTSVPEVDSTLGLLLVGGILGISYFKRKNQEKTISKLQ